MGKTIIYKNKNIEVAQRFEWNKTPEQLEKDLGFNQDFYMYFAMQAYKYMSRFVPMESGALDQLANISATQKEGLIEYLVPYANYQYTGIGHNFSKEQHPLATSYWDKAMMIADGKRLMKDVDEHRKRLAK